MYTDQASLPIAIFDSGVGGLTVAKVLKEKHPNESIIYLADTSNRPFGTKNEQTLLSIIKKNCEFLKTQKIKALLIACHTACSLGLEIYKELQIPVYGITSSSIKTLKRNQEDQQLVILATERTIKSQLYQKALASINHPFPPVFIANSCIEKMIESIETDESVISSELSDSLIEITNKERLTILLGCTHFPIYKKHIHKVIGTSSQLIDPADDFVDFIMENLTKLGLKTPSKTSVDEYIVTSDAEVFKQKFYHYFSESLKKTNHFFNLSCAII